MTNGPVGIKLKTQNGREFMKGTNGAGHVRPISGTGKVAKNRYLVAVTAADSGIPAANTATWTAAEEVTEITISVSAATGAVSANDDGVRVVFDAIDDANAKVLVDQAGGAAATVQTFWIPNNSTRTFNGMSYFTRADFVSVGDTMRVTLEAN